MTMLLRNGFNSKKWVQDCSKEHPWNLISLTIKLLDIKLVHAMRQAPGDVLSV